MGEDEFDFGSLFGGGETDMSNFDMGSLDLGSLADLGSLSDLGNFDIGSLDLGNLDLGNIGSEGIDFSSILDSLKTDRVGGQNLDLESLLKNIGGGDESLTRSLSGEAPVQRTPNAIAPGDYAPLTDQLAELMGAGSTKTSNLGMGDLADESGSGAATTLAPREDNPNLEVGRNADGSIKTVAQRFAEEQQRAKDAENKNVYDQEDAEAGLASLKPQELGISQKNIDEAQSVFAQNKTPSGWQKVGSDLINVRDDGTANAINTETGESYSLTADQVANMDKKGLLESKTSGYVDVTGGKGFVPGGGKTIENSDGTKTVITTDGKVLTTQKNGTIVDTGKKVDVNNKALDTIKDTVTTSTDDVVKKLTTAATDAVKKTSAATPAAKSDNLGMLMMMMALMAMMNKGGGSTSSGATIPGLSADRKQLPYGGGGSNYRPGQGGVNYFTPTTYTTKAAGGGLMSLNGGGHLGGYSDGGRLLRGPGDGVSDSIPATIGGKQPARLATGEFVVPARIVSELGNGSTDAGAQRLYEMMDRVQHARRKTKNVAANTKAAKYLPA
jgi:hypothetical protein